LRRRKRQKDAQAVKILGACVDAAGGIPTIIAIQDFAATGNATYYWAKQSVAASVALKGRGVSQFRVDAILDSGTRSWSASNGMGTLVDVDGTRRAIPFYNAVNVGVLSWRLPNIMAALTDPTMTVSYVGLVQSNNGQAYQIHVQQTDASNPDPVLANIKAVDYFVDPKTYLLLQTVDSTYSTTDLTQAYQHAVLFSDYRNVSGVMVPFSITEKISDQSTWSIQLDSITFNVGLGAEELEGLLATSLLRVHLHNCPPNSLIHGRTDAIPHFTPKQKRGHDGERKFRKINARVGLCLSSRQDNLTRHFMELEKDLTTGPL
jgi:hypothetical protein